MRRTSEPVWAAARRNIDDIPDRPTLLSEPAYAALAYETECQLRCQVGSSTCSLLLETWLEFNITTVIALSQRKF